MTWQATRIAIVTAAACAIATVAHAQLDVEPASLMTTPIFLFNGGQAVSQGTGFFFANLREDGTPDTVFLVTNVHVLTGHAPTTPTPKAGDRIQFLFHEDHADLTKVRHVELPLYDATGQPTWLASERVPSADVALVPIPASAYAGIPLFVFTDAHVGADVKIRPASTATLIGYPYALADVAHNLPVWKTGHVATEPDVDFDDRPVFLVDVSAFPGMSGSPVLFASSGVYETTGGEMRSGRVLKLLGIFSAMPTVVEGPRGDRENAGSPAAGQETSLQLGYVWKAALITELARGARTSGPTRHR